MYDAIVVGARCAGAPTAMLLARRGYKVLLIDRAAFPSDKMSTHYIVQAGIAILKRWGLLKRLAATGCPPIRRVSTDRGDFTLLGSPTPLGGVTEAYAPRRKILDHLLLQAAIEAGVEVRERFSLQRLTYDRDHVTGIVGATQNGTTQVENATIVIGADGMRSRVATLVGAQEYNARPALGCVYYSYWSGVHISDIFEGYFTDGRVVLAFPTHDGLVCLFVEWPNREFHAFRSDIEGNFMRTIDRSPGLAERVRAGRREERFVGTADLPNFFRRPYGAGWALVGDAGYHRDPLTGQGITDSFRSAEMLAEAIDAGLGGDRPLEVALGEYERRRNEAVMGMYEFTCASSSLEPTSPEVYRLREALRCNQAQTDRYYGALSGTVSLDDFFSPENIQLLMGANSDDLRYQVAHLV